MEHHSFVIAPEEAEAGVSAPEHLPLLIEAAISLARPPVSKFKVGVVGLGSSGRIFLGVNVEFPGLPLHHSIHAEQFLVTNLTLHSEPHLRYLAISSHGSIFGAPCGHCRQFLQEIRDASEIKILITHPNCGNEFVRLESLLPHRFGPEQLLEKDVPLLLEPHDNRLTLSTLDSDFPDGEISSYSDLKSTGLGAANRSYAPYSKCPSGAALVDCEGKVYRGWYMESAAFNPSLGPVQAALVDFVARGGGQGFERIVGAVLVEKKDDVVRQEHTAAILLQTIAPKCDFKVFHCCECEP